jgi:hypothetical protein
MWMLAKQMALGWEADGLCLLSPFQERISVTVVTHGAAQEGNTQERLGLRVGVGSQCFRALKPRKAASRSSHSNLTGAAPAVSISYRCELDTLSPRLRVSPFAVTGSP